MWCDVICDGKYTPNFLHNQKSSFISLFAKLYSALVMFPLFFYPLIKWYLQLRVIFELLPPAPRLPFPDETSCSFILSIKVLDWLPINSCIVSEFFDVQMLHQLLHFSLIHFTTQKVADLFDNVLHVSDDIFIEEEQQIWMAFKFPSLLYMLEIWTVINLSLLKSLREWF